MSKPNETVEPSPLYFSGSNGIELVADSFGPNDGPLVVFLHGGGQNRHSWKKSGGQLAATGARVIALDARGHGESEWAKDGSYERLDMAADLICVLKELGAPAVVVGASMGGLTALLATTLVGPDVISGLVLVDVVPRPEMVGIQRVIDFLTANTDGFANLDEAADAVAEYLPHRPRPKSNEGLKKNLRLREDGRWYWHWDPAFITGPEESRQSRDEQVAAMEQAARDLTIPVLLIRGKMSDVVSQDGVDHFRELVPHAEFVELSGAAHTAAGDDNDAFTDAVYDFVVAHAVRKS